jgi:hypothetical protein
MVHCQVNCFMDIGTNDPVIMILHNTQDRHGCNGHTCGRKPRHSLILDTDSMPASPFSFRS